MSDKYTPMTADVRRAYCTNQGPETRTGPEFDRWLAAHDAELAEKGQSVIDEHMRKVSHRVMDVFEAADEETLADEIMTEVFAAIGLVEAFTGPDQQNGSK